MSAKTILLADDDSAIRTVLTQALSRAGYSVRSTATATALWRWVAEGQGDVVVTDVVLPGGMNGRQLADAAMKGRPRLKVLFTTGYTRNAIVHNGQLDPGIQLLGKPFTYSDLAAKIRAVLDAD